MELSELKRATVSRYSGENVVVANKDMLDDRNQICALSLELSHDVGMSGLGRFRYKAVLKNREGPLSLVMTSHLIVSY